MQYAGNNLHNRTIYTTYKVPSHEAFLSGHAPHFSSTKTLLISQDTRSSSLKERERITVTKNKGKIIKSTPNNDDG